MADYKTQGNIQHRKEDILSTDTTYGSIDRDQGRDNSESHKPTKTSFTANQKWTLFSISLANFSDFVSYSILAPFFPEEANKMGMSDSVVGLVFGCFALVMFITSPVFGKFLTKIGVKFMFIAGSFTCGVCCIIYGFLIRLDKGTEFIVFCFVVRSIEAVGSAASATAAFAIIAKTFPENIATTLGVLEIFSGLGFMLGPLIGGYLYQVGGFTLPFLVLGIFTIVITLCNIYILPRQQDEGTLKSGSMTEFLKIPSVIMTSLCVLAGSVALSFLDPTLAKHLNQFNFNSTTVGLMFLIMAGSYTLSAFFWGWITDKKNIPKLLMIIGNIGCGAAYLYLGPTPLFNVKTELWMVIFSLVLLGLAVGCALVPTFTDMIGTARWYGMQDNFVTYGIVSGVFNGLFSLGSFIGPTVGGAMEQAYGFSWAASVMALIYFTVTTLLIIFCLWEYQCGKGRRIATHRENVIVVPPDLTNDINSPLLNP
ncbi:MFS-type transporter SLC18B1-like [Saccoglossus kowalevskii]|uniref:MFS-type transporter SLC18B1-like n=1 Tax=Saccoglossus kowalevskii TaxID=10224 RepID=A0ABM0GLE3_SACKO|nr:PREDICTED: MFS-type transporter SLC18B1-like [Saccoglossus kowalevskii]